MAVVNYGKYLSELLCLNKKIRFINKKSYALQQNRTIAPVFSIRIYIALPFFKLLIKGIICFTIILELL